MAKFTITLPKDHEVLAVLEANRNLRYSELIEEYRQFQQNKLTMRSGLNQLTIVGEISNVQTIQTRFNKMYQRIISGTDSNGFLIRDLEMRFNNDSDDFIRRHREISNDELNHFIEVVKELATLEDYDRFVVSKTEFASNTQDGEELVELTIIPRKYKSQFKDVQAAAIELAESFQKLSQLAKHLKTLQEKMHEYKSHPNVQELFESLHGPIDSTCVSIIGILQSIIDQYKIVLLPNVEDTDEEYFMKKGLINNFKDACKSYLMSNNSSTRKPLDRDRLAEEILSFISQFTPIKEYHRQNVQLALEGLEKKAEEDRSSTVRYIFNGTSGSEEDLIFGADSDDIIGMNTRLNSWLRSLPCVVEHAFTVRVQGIFELTNTSLAFEYHIFDQKTQYIDRPNIALYKGESLYELPEYLEIEDSLKDEFSYSIGVLKRKSIDAFLEQYGLQSYNESYQSSLFALSDKIVIQL